MTGGIALTQVMSCLTRAQLVGEGSTRVCDVHHDSRRVTPGTLFLVRHGARQRGGQFVPEAKAKGAVALVTEEPALAAEFGLPALVVDDVRRAAGFAAEAVYGRVGGDGFDVVGVTGTNGKTTVTFLVEAMLRATGCRAARLGTLGGRYDDVELAGELTTPEADDLARTAAHLRSLGATHLALEVSSHALALGRVEAVRFRTAAFTNLSRDHLDFHGSFAAYGEAKARLFTELAPGASVINVDDPFGARLVGRVGGPCVQVSPGGAAAADVAVTSWVSTMQGSHGRVRLGGREYVVTSPLFGEHNRENVAVALGVMRSLGHGDEGAVQGLAHAPQVPGRLERCSEADDPFAVVVDYAHTPDALARTLAVLRPLTRGKLWCVFGCGGDRDAGKRALMGEVAGRAADEVVVTDDNPRTEDPGVITQAIESGLRATGRAFVCLHDRAEAIAYAVVRAQAGDTVVVAGKGHETYQLVGDRRFAFDDRDHTRRALAQRRLTF